MKKVTLLITLLVGMVLGIGIVINCKKTEVTKAEAKTVAETAVTQPQKWEYKEFKFSYYNKEGAYRKKKNENIIKDLNKLGTQGWESAFVVHEDVVYFKRPIK